MMYEFPKRLFDGARFNLGVLDREPDWVRRGGWLSR